MTRDEVKRIVEVLLFVSDKPLAPEKINNVLEDSDKDTIRSIIEELSAEYQATRRSFSIVEVAGGFQILTDQFYAPWIRRLFQKDKKHRLSTPSLETLAIIAYRQPITRADIEAIRGVNIEGVLDTLTERGVIKTVGRKDMAGKPYLYGTTDEFLTHFGLKGLGSLPRLSEYSENDIQLGRDELIKKETDDIDIDESEISARAHDSMEARPPAVSGEPEIIIEKEVRDESRPLSGEGRVAVDKTIVKKERDKGRDEDTTEDIKELAGEDR